MGISQAAFEERWRIGGFSFLGAFYDILLDERANALAAEFVRGKIRAIVRDPETARRLCPTQPIGCKRLCIDSVGYYETFNRPNVRLVDVGGDNAIDEITPTGRGNPWKRAPGASPRGGRSYQNAYCSANDARRLAA